MNGNIHNPVTSEKPRRAKRSLPSSQSPRKRSPTHQALDQKRQSLTTTNFSSPELSDSTLTHWPCSSCPCPQGAFHYPVDNCIRCGHTMDDHEDFDHLWDPECDFVCQRPDLVYSIVQLVRSTRVVVIRATPQVGKTTLLRLLGRHILYEEEDLEPVFILWRRREMRREMGDSLPYKQYLEQEKSRWQEDNAKYRPYNPKATTVNLIDEAQDSYEEENFWAQTLKNPNTRQQSMFVLVCLYGATGVSRMREPNNESQALRMDRLQRVELRPSALGRPYMLFKPQETAVTVQKWAMVNKFQLEDEVAIALREVICLNAIERFSPSVLRSRNCQSIPEAAFQDELYCCLNYELQSLPILSEYSHTKDGRVDFYIFDKKWGIEVLQSRRKEVITEHARRFQTGGKYQQWNIFDDYVILNFCSKPALREIEIDDLEECTAEVYTHDMQLQKTSGLGEGRQRYYVDDFDRSENSTLQDQLTPVGREKEDMMREKEDMMRRIAELEQQAKQN
ncbi:uncharacterized protein BDZ99DRAFT_504827 [Mytilinidion resinicola]|uniref:P-loop containing nucleoside triphosphate hydrolase protein n=1 Tax=Mytilinidion resinicola TaxID=574789 RepID=A0A6A6Z775_9PEZI|nr:uncharacterized protein BDZ99DRAFT_504827 [Mytilinidion resinicola]KAF2816880.1 hypothetical protein BDZ99DRAFT_504827 [Mytilinidion resinicola]